LLIQREAGMESDSSNCEVTENMPLQIWQEKRTYKYIVSKESEPAVGTVCHYFMGIEGSYTMDNDADLWTY